MVTIPRAEYPRPQFVRQDWECLNGEWEFELDPGDSGLERGLLHRALEQRILVPFCPESELSGIGNTDFITAVWYRKCVTMPESWAGKRILLHFQAVDYDTTVWVNGVEVIRHRGGFTPFTCDLGKVLRPGERQFTIVLRARDGMRQPQPRGKQSPAYANFGCLYTRTTGIWQTVWMEPVADVYLGRARITPDLPAKTFHVEAPLIGAKPGYTLKAILADGSEEISQAKVSLGLSMSTRLDLAVPADRLLLWEPGAPFLYDLEFVLLDGEGTEVDRVKSYAGMRSLAIDGQRILINGRPVFQRLVLDQGFYPDGILTAASDEVLENDIHLSLAAGFNGARLHQKVFEERFLFHADRLGYLVWGEFPDWGCSGFGAMPEHQQPNASYITQWLEALERDYSHPSIVGWCPLNETWQVLTDRITQLDDVTRGMYLATKAFDQSRPVLDASGYSHRVYELDVYDSHTYEQDVARFAKEVGGLAQGRPFTNRNEQGEFSLPYQGQPYMVSEFGGIWWNPQARQDEDSWGYGTRPANLEAWYERFSGLCNTLLDDPRMFGYCYTQLTDVFQEQNGIYNFNRQPKFDLARLRTIQQRTAAFEK